MDKGTIVGVIGAGTMGGGIAQVAAQAGHAVVLYDARREAVDGALAGLRGTLDRLVGKGKLTTEQADAVHGRITPATSLDDLAGCGLVIEAIAEDIGAKKKLFVELEGIVPADAVLATNTSSLSVTAIAAACAKPERVIGLHFFNPAPLMPLVEVVPGLVTDVDLPAKAVALMSAWGKTPVTCKDTPGFIVNRVARPFYGESIRILEEGIASMPAIDAALRTLGGFRMGPFELMDLIGNDINLMVTRTVWEAFHYDPRYRPSITQQRQVESGRLGRKTGRGYYRYDPNGAIVPDTRTRTSAGSLVEDPAGKADPTPAGSPRASGDPAQVEGTSAGSLAEDPAGKANPTSEVPSALGTAIVERVLAMLINEAADALFWGVASARDIDLAMTKGVNYPKGLLAWADEQGAAHWLAVLERLQAAYGEDRYRPSPLLRQVARSKKGFQ